MLDNKEKWNRCLEFICNNVGEKPFSTWFGPIVFEGIKNKQAVLRVPTNFFCEYIEEHYIKILRSAIQHEFGNGIGIVYNVVVDSGDGYIEKTVSSTKERAEAEYNGNKSPKLIDGIVSNSSPQLDSRLNPDYTFDNFIEGSSNKLARSIGMSIADNPGQMTFNPFFIFGKSGVGKTHLVNAIGNRIKSQNPSTRVLYVSAHLFMVQYGDASRQNKRNDFINFYQGIDVLIIDDIQELAGETKKATQEAFFHIFNHLQQTHHQLIMTSDRPPMELDGVEERLLTRFKWGLVTELPKPDAKLAKKILLSKIKSNGLSFPKEVVEYISANASENIRDLEGVVNAILAYSVVYDSDVDMELTRRVVARSVKQKDKNITVESILDKVGKFYEVSTKEICSVSRKQRITQARQVAMYLVQKHTGISYSRIGSVIGKRDHSTVLHSCSVVEHRISTDKSFRKDLENIEADL